MNAIDDISRRRNRQRFAVQPLELDCDTHGCVARGVFDTKPQIGNAGWLVSVAKDIAGRAVVNVLCPCCVQSRRAQHEPPSFFGRSRE